MEFNVLTQHEQWQIQDVPGSANPWKGDTNQMILQELTL